MKFPLWARDEVLYQYGFIELYWLYREWSNIITWRAVSIKTGRSNILSRLEVTVKWDAWTVEQYLNIYWSCFKMGDTHNSNCLFILLSKSENQKLAKMTFFLTDVSGVW